VTDGAARTSDVSNLRRELRALYKELVWSVTRHRPGPHRNICLFATRRGGSTWLMEVIGANHGVRPLDQPFSSTTGTLTAAQFRAMPKFDGGIVVGLDDEQEPQFRRFVDRVMRGELPINAPTRFWSRDFEFRSSRLLLKITDANSLIDWFDDNYDIDVVYLSRHPIPQALSCIRNGWTLHVRPFLRNERFVQQHLDASLVAYAHEVLETGSQLDRFVLNWTLENLVPIRLLAERPRWTYLSYEQCVLEPGETVRSIGAALGLTDAGAMERKLASASRSSILSAGATVERIAAGDRASLVNGWHDSVGAEEERAAMEILERFGIDLYRYGSDTPTPRARFGAPALQ
jgi:hypothetical protein